MQYENEARVFFTAKSENEGFARLFAAGFLTQLDPTISEMTDVKTAVSEAVTNAIIHGYEEKGGLVELFCGYIGRKIYIEIADTGKGIENRAALYLQTGDGTFRYGLYNYGNLYGKGAY